MAGMRGFVNSQLGERGCVILASLLSVIISGFFALFEVYLRGFAFNLIEIIEWFNGVFVASLSSGITTIYYYYSILLY